MMYCEQMIRKSVETHDWLNSLEPRNVRAIMKHVVEEVTMIDKQVGLLYVEGQRKRQYQVGVADRLHRLVGEWSALV